MTELVRYLAVMNCALLVGGGAFLRVAFRGHVPRPLDVAAIAYGVVFVSVAAGLIANVFTPIPPTPGAKVFLGFSSGAVLVVFGVCTHAVRSHRN